MTANRHRESLLRLADVTGRTGLSRTTIYNRMRAGTFPACLRISTGLVAWYASDLDAWLTDPMGWRAPAIAA